MFENMTYEYILNRCLSSVSDNIDKRQGSVIYDAIAPACAEMAKLYIELDRVLNETFADTASREFLIKRAYERDIYPKEASCAILLGEFNIEIEEGTRFNLGILNYYRGEFVKKENNLFYYNMICETSGEIGNIINEHFIPIEYIENLNHCYAKSIIYYGEDEEDTESFRKRYFQSIKNKSFAGNINYYKQETKSIEGVGGVKVIPTWNGGGTVKIIITDSGYLSSPKEELVKDVQSQICPAGSDGTGIAPIGHDVKVVGCNSVGVNVELCIIYDTGYLWKNIDETALRIIKSYFISLNKSWENKEKIIIYKMHIASLILDIQGITNVEDVFINGNNTNFILDNNSIIDVENIRIKNK